LLYTPMMRSLCWLTLMLATPVLAQAPLALPLMTKYVNVFGVGLYATASVGDELLQHSAGVMAQYLDNDADGKADNPALVAVMVAKQASMILFFDESEFDDFFDEIEASDIEERLDSGALLLQDLFASEIQLNPSKQAFDATLEEVLHLVTHAGYAQAWPQTFAELAGSDLTRAMDVARGGHFEDIPSNYPSQAWYRYDDDSCDYACMATEYFYWSLTSLLGAQSHRLDDIGHEWRLNTPAKMQQDVLMYALLTDPQWRLPTQLPNGRYQPKVLTIGSVLR